MTTAPAFTRDGNCVTADARNNTPAGTGSGEYNHQVTNLK